MSEVQTSYVFKTVGKKSVAITWQPELTKEEVEDYQGFKPQYLKEAVMTLMIDERGPRALAYLRRLVDEGILVEITNQKDNI